MILKSSKKREKNKGQERQLNDFRCILYFIVDFIAWKMCQSAKIILHTVNTPKNTMVSEIIFYNFTSFKA